MRMGEGDRPTRVSRNTDDDVVDAVPGRRDDPSAASLSSSSSSTTTTTGVSMRWITRDGRHPLGSHPVDNDVMPASPGTTRASAVAAVAGRHRRRRDGRRRRRRPLVVVRPRPRPRRSIGIGGRRCRGRGGFPPRGAMPSCTSLFGRTSPYAIFNFPRKTCFKASNNMNSSFKASSFTKIFHTQIIIRIPRRATPPPRPAVVCSLFFLSHHSIISILSPAFSMSP